MLPSDRDRTIQEARRFLSSAMISKIQRTSLLSLGGTNIQSVLEHESEKYDKFTVNWGTSYTINYGIEEVFDEIDLLFCSGRDIDVLTTSPSKKTSHLDWSKYDYFKVLEQVPQQEFWAKISKCHAFLYYPDHSEGSYSVLEQQLLGLIGVFKKADHLEGLLYSGYPFISDSHIETARFLRYIYENYHSDEIKHVRARQREWITENFDIHTRNSQILDAIQQIYDDYQMIWGLSMVELFKSFPNKLNHDEWVEMIKEKSENHIDVLNQQGRFDQTKNKFRRIMEVAGYKDDCKTDMPVFIK